MGPLLNSLPLSGQIQQVSLTVHRFCPQRDVTILGGGDRDWLIEYQCYVMEDVDLAGLELSIPGLRGKFLLRCIACFYMLLAWIMYTLKPVYQTSQELRMLSSVTLKCQITKIVVNSGSQLSEL